MSTVTNYTLPVSFQVIKVTSSHSLVGGVSSIWKFAACVHERAKWLQVHVQRYVIISCESLPRPQHAMPKLPLPSEEEIQQVNEEVKHELEQDKKSLKKSEGSTTTTWQNQGQR